MGNCICIGSKSSIVWAGDEWEEESMHMEAKKPKREKQRLMAQNRAFSSSCSSSSSSSSLSSASSTSSTEVKIKITKKQLEELLGRGEVHHMPVDQVVSSLIDASDRFEIQHQRSWRPTLNRLGVYVQDVDIALDRLNVKAYLRRGTPRESLLFYKESLQDFRHALVLEPQNKVANLAEKRLRKLTS
ncbi:unnamed protein product [Camellia sinensis]